MALQEDTEQLRAADIMTREVITAKPTETVVDAARKMDQYKIGSVVVVSIEDERRVVGILTEADIVRRVVARGLDPRTTLIGDVMTKNPIVVQEDTPATYIAELMRRKDVGHIPVVNGAGRLVGIIARTDILRLAPELIELLYLRTT